MDGVTDNAMFRVANTWLGMPSFKIMCAYVVLILAISPVWRRLVSPLRLGFIVVLYNLVCSVLSMITLVLFFVPLLSGMESWFSIQPCKSQWLPLAFQLYYYTKVFELLDTVWMVLRHKGRQITVLHVYHHAIMVVLGGAAYMTRLPAIAFGLGMNSGVHVVMYVYYCVTAWRSMSPADCKPSERRPSFLFSPFMERTLPFLKQRMTEMQLLQFFLAVVNNGWGYMHHQFCAYSVLFVLTLVVLFANFYYRAYMSPKKDGKANGAARNKTD